MDDRQLQRLVKQISHDFFQQPFHHYARFNPRLRTTGGRYLLHTHDIELNPKQYEIYGLETLIAIIKHELCHYHLHLQKKGYRHRDKDFKDLLKNVGGARYCQVIEGTRRNEQVKHTYECLNCGQFYPRKRLVNTSRFVCGRCRGRLRKH